MTSTDSTKDRLGEAEDINPRVEEQAEKLVCPHTTLIPKLTGGNLETKDCVLLHEPIKPSKDKP